jgi:predicted GH43/DUF377 family glycosyl hydrolase
MDHFNNKLRTNYNKIYIKTYDFMFNKSIFRKIALACSNNNKRYISTSSLKGKKINISNNMVDKDINFFNCLNFGSTNQQLELYGGKFYSLNTGKLGFDNIFNPSIIQYNNKLFMTFRVDITKFSRKTYFCEIDNNFNIISSYDILNNDNKMKAYEDSRLFIYKNNLYVSFIQYTYNFLFRVNFANIIPGSKIKNKNIYTPDIDNNNNIISSQKNWLFFEKNNEIHVIYSLDPMIIVYKSESNKFIKWKQIIKKIGISWDYGEIRSSTTPIFIKKYNRYISFFHSHLKTKDFYKEYFIGVFLFDDEYNITNYTKKPLIISTKDDVSSYCAKCILPYGCIQVNNNLILTVGINDSESGIIELPIDKLFNMLLNKV